MFRRISYQRRNAFTVRTVFSVMYRLYYLYSIPLVFVNISASSCDALVLLPTGSVKLVNLPALSQRRAETMRNLWLDTVGLRRASRRRDCHGSQERRATQVRASTNMYYRILDRLWTWIVHPILSSLNLVSDV